MIRFCVIFINVDPNYVTFVRYNINVYTVRITGLLDFVHRSVF
jgi:hypothetical protein